MGESRDNYILLIIYMFKIMEQKNYNSIDLFKFVMAICVVAIHTNPMDKCTIKLVNDIYTTFVGMAVPFFFIATGFLLANKMEYPFWGTQNKTIMKNYLFRIIKLYLLWTVLYMPLAAWHFVSTGTPLIRAILQYIRGFILLGEQYNSWPLWYLLSTIYTLMLLILLLKHKKSLKTILAVGGVVFLFRIGLVYIVEYDGVFTPVVFAQKILNLTIMKGAVFTGMFYIPVGMALSRKKMPDWASWAVMICSFAINIAIEESGISSILTAMTVIALFIFVKGVNLKDSFVYFILRKMSSVIYFVHMYAWSIYYKLIYGEKTYGFDCFVATLFISILIALIYVVFIRKNRFLKSCRLMGCMRKL